MVPSIGDMKKKSRMNVTGVPAIKSSTACTCIHILISMKTISGAAREDAQRNANVTIKRSIVTDKRRANVHAEVPNAAISIESEAGSSRRSDARRVATRARRCVVGRGRVSPAYLRSATSARATRARARSSGVECGPVPERARASASAGERCAIVPVFYRFVMH